MKKFESNRIARLLPALFLLACVGVLAFAFPALAEEDEEAAEEGGRFYEAIWALLPPVIVW